MSHFTEKFKALSEEMNIVRKRKHIGMRNKRLVAEFDRLMEERRQLYYACKDLVDSGSALMSPGDAKKLLSALAYTEEEMP